MAIEDTVRIDGKDVRFKCSANTTVRYKEKFSTDLLQDLRSVSEEMRETDESTESLPVSALDVFTRLAYIMALDGDPDSVPDNPGAWLDGFSPLFIYEVIPVVQALWLGNLKRLEEAKKKVGRLSGLLQPRCSCSEPCSSGCRCETSN